MASYQDFCAKFISMISPKSSIVKNNDDVDGASRTHSARAAIFSGVSTVWLFTLWFTDENASFFQFFHKIKNLRS